MRSNGTCELIAWEVDGGGAELVTRNGFVCMCGVCMCERERRGGGGGDSALVSLRPQERSRWMYETPGRAL